MRDSCEGVASEGELILKHELPPGSGGVVGRLQIYGRRVPVFEHDGGFLKEVGIGDPIPDGLGLVA